MNQRNFLPKIILKINEPTKSQIKNDIKILNIKKIRDKPEKRTISPSLKVAPAKKNPFFLVIASDIFKVLLK